MAYLSDLMGRPVTDVDGELVGRLDDLIASVPSGGSHPVIKAVVVKRGGEVLTIPSAEVAVLVAPSIPLNRRLQELAPYQPGPRDMHLVQDVLDKQIIDTNGVRVVRVNDLELTRIDAQYVVANVDFGTLGLLRRLGMARSVQRLAALFGKRLHPGLVSWEQVELLPGDPALRLKVPGEKITELHPADLAEIISDLTRSEGGQLLASLDVRTVADTLESVEPEFQASLVAAMSDEKVADVLEEMAPDEAADLLAELPQDRSRDLLLLMEDSEAADVRRLLAYPEDTAGGIMTTDVISFPPDLTAEAALARLRQMAPEADTLRALNIAEADAPQFVFYRSVGCEECNHTGYRGRIAIYEVMRVSDKVRRLIAQKAGEDMIREAAVSSGMITLGEDGLAKVKTGVTTAEELLRVVTEVREIRTLCPGCGGAVAMDFLACPHCGNRLSGGCPKCGRSLQPGWSFCPFCATTTAAPAKSKKKLRQQGKTLELPASNVTEFKNQNR